MKTLHIYVLLSLFIFSCGSTQQKSKDQQNTAPADPKVYAESITAEELKTLLYTFASDEFMGRGTGEPGERLATRFLQQHYEELGVGAPVKNNYFQNVPLIKQYAAQTDLTINGVGVKSAEDIVTTNSVPNQHITFENLVYVGYGIDDENYSDYANIDVKGKIVLAKEGEPKLANGNYIISNSDRKSPWSEGRRSGVLKRSTALKHGAKALLYLDESTLQRTAAYLKSVKNTEDIHQLLLRDEQDQMPHILISEAIAKNLYTEITTSNTPKTVTVKGWIDIKSDIEHLYGENVLAYIKGSEFPDEVVVISAHLDHEGVKNGEIYNGADDDGSGSVALLEIAEAFKKAKDNGHGPKRSVLFLHVTGEEKGLLGSRYYTDFAPVFPLAKTVANLNIDMIGRIDPKREGDRNYIYLIGSNKLSSELHDISEEANALYSQIELDYTFNADNDPNQFYYRSDHYNFAKNNIPVIFYFNGTHDDYHRPSDTPDKIEYDLLENRTRLVFYTAWELVNRNERLKLD